MRRLDQLLHPIFTTAADYIHEHAEMEVESYRANLLPIPGSTIAGRHRPGQLERGIGAIDGCARRSANGKKSRFKRSLGARPCGLQLGRDAIYFSRLLFHGLVKQLCGVIVQYDIETVPLRDKVHRCLG